MIDAIVVPRVREVAGLPVLRVLPSLARRSVGPFVFLDQMGPHALAPGHGVDVPPHPHIGLATVTYLFEGDLVHRDSLGSLQPIRPGDINWMTAGRGIAHSERSGDAARAAGSRMHGVQLWVALPRDAEEAPPAFHHHPAATLPGRDDGGVAIRLLVGEAFGLVSPVAAASPLVYADLALPAGRELALPEEIEERALFVARGACLVGDTRVTESQLVALRPGPARVRADGDARLLLLGGPPLDGHRHLWWNFVSSSRDRIEQAKRDWREGRFAPIPGDDRDRVPLPD